MKKETKEPKTAIGEIDVYRNFALAELKEICERIGLPCDTIYGKPISMYSTTEIRKYIILLLRIERSFHLVSHKYSNITEFAVLILRGEAEIPQLELPNNDYEKEFSLERNT